MYKVPSLYQSLTKGPDSLYCLKWGKFLNTYSDSLYCGKWGKFLNTYSDLDLDPTKLNVL